MTFVKCDILGHCNHGHIEQPSGPHAAPEIDPYGATAAITLLVFGLAVVLGSKRK
jgi:hypothetical protein